MTPVSFSTSELNDNELSLINVLLTYAKHDTAGAKRAIEYVLTRLTEETTL